MKASETISTAIRAAKAQGQPAIVAYLTAGFPEPANFIELLRAIASVADVVEVGVPFTDPMADGLTIQRSSRAALQKGVTLKWILQELRAFAANRGGGKAGASTSQAASTEAKAPAPILLMSYLNPLLAYGLSKLAADAERAGVAGFIVPDLPYEESAELRAALDAQGLALVQMVTPVTPPERLKKLCAAGQGFNYAVTMTGTTGKSVSGAAPLSEVNPAALESNRSGETRRESGSAAAATAQNAGGIPAQVLDYMDRVRAVSPIPVCAGFGIRSREQVRRMAPHVDGVVVGSALVEVLERGEDPAAYLRSLRG